MHTHTHTHTYIYIYIHIHPCMYMCDSYTRILHRDSIVVPLINCLTSFYSGFAIFSVLGFMAVQKGVTVDEVAASG